ncbi:MAG: universal stress protein [Acidimicrobiaceae bacterium]|nr:universal stress protein [Acidimicrobiaceae bacterium]
MPASTPTMVKAAVIIVGVDGSPGGDAALAWALEEARLRGSEVEALVARTVRLAGREHLSYDEFTPARCEHLLAESLVRVGGPGGVPLRLETRDDDVLFELGLEASARGAGLIVVGAPSHGHLHAAPAPTTLLGFTHRFSCPVVVVPSDFVRQRTRRMMVAVGEAGEGAEALRWGVEEAGLTGASVEVVSLASTPAGEPPTVSGPVDLLVVEMPAGHWRRRCPASKATRHGVLPGNVPVVFVPASS